MRFLSEDKESPNKKQLKFDGPTIIYCQSRAMTSEISNELQSIGIKSKFYHAGLSIEVRKRVQIDFINDKIDVRNMKRFFN